MPVPSGKQVLCALLLALLATAAGTQEQHTAHTLTLTGESPPAKIDDVAWIAGHWHGEALGGIVDEVWSPPAGGAMMAMFRLVKDGKPAFYEIVTLVEEGGSLLVRLKHFHPDLVGWEEKDESISFPLVKVEPGKAYFDGLTFLRPDPGTLQIYVASKKSDGSVSELVFQLKRVE